MAYLKNILNKIKLSTLFYLWSIHGLIAVWGFLTSRHFKPSLAYLIIAFLLFLWIVLSFAFALFDQKEIPQWVVWRNRYNTQNIRTILFFISTILISICLGLWYLRNLFSQELNLQIGGYLDILAPVLNLIGYISVEIFFVNLKYDSDYKIFPSSFLRFFFALLFAFGLVAFFISKTGLGVLESYKGDWNRGLPAVPLLEWQIILASFFCILIMILERKIKSSNFKYVDILICILIWMGASVIWLSTPIIPHPSALTPHAPNYEIYPFIDSQTYDVMAQSLLIGDRFGSEKIPLRPLYVVFLAFIHVLVGQDYSHVIFVQTLFFAFFPMLLFLLGRDFFGRPIGVAIALLAILRDYTSNIVSPFTGNLSYSKVYLSEIPTAILLILFLVIGIRWIRSNYPIYLSILLGGVLGSAMLIRTQSFVLIPVIILFSILSKPRKIVLLMKSTIFMLLFTAVVVSPWLWRNWKITGALIFDNPESQIMNLTLRYSRVNGVEGQVERLPNETSSEFSARLKKIALDAILSNPTGAAWAFTNSFINHGINNILLFPVRDEIKSFDELRFPSEAFWEKWKGTPTASQTILIVFYIFLFCLGVTMAWQKNGWLGLLPLGLNLIYNLWTSIALLSGQRFMLTMDWSIYFYYMIGIFSLIGGFLYMLDANSRSLILHWIKNNSIAMAIPYSHTSWQKFFFVGMLFLGIGLSLPLAERSFPERYPKLSQEQLIASLIDSTSLVNSPIPPACFKRLANTNQLNIEQGMALYPRYYLAGEGEDFTDTPGYKVVNIARLVFDIIGQVNHRVIFPMKQSPDFFPHTADVTLISSNNKELWFIFVDQGQNERFYISDDFDTSLCN